jgi:phosphoglycolate phosphatase
MINNLLPIPVNKLRNQASHGSIGLLKAGMNITPDSPDFKKLRDAFLDYYSKNICVETKIFPGMDALVTSLEQRKIPWGIVTNKPHRFTVPLIEALGYTHRAQCLISGDTCAHPKPHPAPLIEASRQLKIAPKYCLYLGDDKRDMDAAQAANMIGVIARYGYIDLADNLSNWPTKISIDSPSQLLHYLVN